MIEERHREDTFERREDHFPPPAPSQPLSSSGCVANADIAAYGTADKLWSILVLPTSCLRLLAFPVLFALVLSPIVRYEPASESTGLLTAGIEAPGNGGSVYGTFDADSSADAASTSTQPTEQGGQASSSAQAIPHHLSHAKSGGDATPVLSGGKKPIKITKQLGQKKDEIQGLSWQAFMSRLWKLWPHLWPSTSLPLQLAVAACVVILLFTSFIVNPAVPNVFGEFVRRLARVSNGRPVDSIWTPFIAWVGLKWIQGNGGLAIVQNLLWIPVQQNADREMQMLLFNHLLNLSLSFHTTRNTGEVLKILDRGSSINNLLHTLLFSAVPTVLDIIIACTIFYFLYGPFLATYIACFMIIYVVFSVVFTGYRTKLRRLAVDRDVRTRGIASDMLANWESVKNFTSESREANRYQDSILSYQETEGQVLRSFSLLNLGQAWIMSMGLLTGSLIIANRVLRGEADVGDFSAFLAYLSQVFGPLDRLGTLYRVLNQNATDAEKLFQLLGQPTEIQDKPGAKDLVVTDGVIEFDDVHFSYHGRDGDTQALRGVSFRIGKGESLALVGESGAGKSTILRLLYRFYDIDSGTIRIDGQDISQVTQKSLRRAIGIVPQDSVLWNDTIGANIAYGKEGATDEEVIAAAKAARMHDRIMSFPEGYETKVGERGVRLSGGEKQRVSLARMFLKSPTILVLDEATSALDTETEREIQKAIADLSRGRSSLSIAHRLSTIINSDQIVVMKDGLVEEHGSYGHLMDLNGHFASMWKKQIHTEAEMVAAAEGDEKRSLKSSKSKGSVKSKSSGKSKSKDTETMKPTSIIEKDDPAPPAAPTASFPAADTEDDDDAYIARASPPSTVHEEDDDTPKADFPPLVEDTDAHDSPAMPDKQPESTTSSIDKPEPESYADAIKSTPPAAPKATTQFPGADDNATKQSVGKKDGAESKKPESKASSIQTTPKRTESPVGMSPNTGFPGASFPGVRDSGDWSSSSPSQRADTPPHSTSPLQRASSPGSPEDQPEGGKRRKRLSSIRAFARRMSDKDVPILSRSNSTREPRGSTDTGRESLDKKKGKD